MSPRRNSEMSPRRNSEMSSRRNSEMSQRRNSEMSPRRNSEMSPNMMCKKAVAIYNTVVQKDNVYMYDYKKAIALFREAANRFEKAAANNQEYYYGETLYYLYECHYYGRGVKKDEDVAKNYLVKSVEKKYSLAYFQTARDIVSDIGDGKYNKADITKINILYRLAISSANKIEKNKERENDIKYHFLQFLIMVFGNYTKQSDQLEKSNVMDILLMCQELISGNHAEAMYMYADILSATDPNANQIYHRIYRVYKKYLINDPKYSANLPKPIDLYIRAANGGELRAAEKIAAHYHAIGNDEEMTWWFWWAVKYNNKQSKRNNPTIFHKIKGDEALCAYFEKMSIESKKQKKTTYHTRMHDYLRKETFLAELVKHRSKYTQTPYKFYT